MIMKPLAIGILIYDCLVITVNSSNDHSNKLIQICSTIFTKYKLM